MKKTILRKYANLIVRCGANVQKGQTVLVLADLDQPEFVQMEVFTQFSSDLDETTKAQLQYGKCLMELLKQPLCNPLSMPQQVITLVAATHKVLVDVEVSKLKAFQMDMLQYFADMHKEIIDELNDKKVLSDELTEKIVEVAEEFKKSRC